MRVPGIAIFATKFAPAIGIEGPREWHPPAGFPVKRRVCGKGEVLDSRAVAQFGAFLSHAGDSYTLRTRPPGITRNDVATTGTCVKGSVHSLCRLRACH